MSMCSSMSGASSSCCSDGPCCSSSPPSNPIEFLQIEPMAIAEYELPSPPEKRSKPKKRKTPYERPTICAICGKESTCLHYGVSSCNGCKTFFRRCVTENKDYKCTFSGNCNINEGFRCRACRWKKCLNLGMDPNGVRKVPNVNDWCDESDPIEEIEEKAVCRINYLQSFQKYANFDCIESLIYTEKKLADFRNPLFHDSFCYYYSNSIQTILSRYSELGKESIKHEIAEDFESTSTSVTSYCEHQRHHFCKDEQQQLYGRRHWLTEDLILSMEMAKTLPSFQKICLADQEKLLKHITLAITMLMQCFYSSKANSDTIICPIEAMPIKMKPKGSKPTPLEEEVFCRIMIPVNQIDLSLQEYLLLKSLIYAYWPTPDILEESRKILRDAWQSYATSLMDYLKISYGHEGGAKKFAQIVSLIETFFNCAKKHKELYALGKVLCRKGPPISNVMEEIMG